MFILYTSPMPGRRKGLRPRVTVNITMDPFVVRQLQAIRDTRRSNMSAIIEEACIGYFSLPLKDYKTLHVDETMLYIDPNEPGGVT
jgi:hypothetical protein